MAQTNLQAIELCLQTAKQLGVPRDQAERFVNKGYIPYPWQWQFHALAREADNKGAAVDLGAGGARGPGKSHCILSQVGLDDCQRVKNLKVLFLRQTGSAAKESFNDLIQKTLLGRVQMQRSNNILTFPATDGQVVLGGFHDEKDIDKYVGIEYDIIIVEELNQLTESKYQMLRGSLRTSKQNWRPRMYTSFNPGGKGHAFVKKRYVTPYRDKTEKETRFVPSTYKQNPSLNSEYIEYLESLEGDLGRAWREGDFDLFEGQYFDTWSDRLHVTKPFIPYRGILIGGLDWGRTGKPEHKAAFSFHLAEVTKENVDDVSFHRVRTFLEVAGKNKTPAQWMERIEEELEKYMIDIADIAWVQADTAIFTPGQDTSKSIADQFKDANDEFGYKLKPASKDRIGGWTNMHTWMSIAPDGIPYYQITENCKYLRSTLPELQHDDLRVEDIDTDGDDHGADDQRYMLKKVKFIDAHVGGVNASNKEKAKHTADMDKDRQIPINLDKMAEAFTKQSRRVYYK